MSRWSNFLDRVDRELDRSIEREPSYSPGRPVRRGSINRYRFMTGWLCTGCGCSDRCECPAEES